MIDIHCHILPDIDDGPATMEKSIEMARLAVDDGITHIIATPHVKDVAFRLEPIENACRGLQERLDAFNIPLQIVRGGEVPSASTLDDFRTHTVQGTHYVLVEFPHSLFPANSREILFTLKMAGLRPVIAHPERNLSIMMQPDRILSLVPDSALVQITAGSLTGEFGEDVRELSRHLLRRRAVHFIASDAHSPNGRAPLLTEARRAASKLVGKKQAQRIFDDNPRRLIQDDDIV